MEEIAHRINKVDRGRLSEQRLGEPKVKRSNLPKSLFVADYTHSSQTMSHSLGIAMLAPGTKFCAADHGVPCAFGPLNSRFCGHDRVRTVRAVVGDLSRQFPSKAFRRDRDVMRIRANKSQLCLVRAP